MQHPDRPPLPSSPAHVASLVAGPLFDTIAGDVAAGRPTAYSKLNHGFWERLIRIERMCGGLPSRDDPAAEEIDRKTGTEAFIRTGFLEEMTSLLGQIHRRDARLRISLSFDAWPGSETVEGTPIEGEAACRAMLARLVPKDFHNDGDGLEFKRAAITGEFCRLAEALRNRDVLLVGPEALAGFGRFIGSDRVAHRAIHETAARAERAALLDELTDRLGPSSGEMVLLMQAGSLAFWLAIHLHQRFPDLTILDLGVVLNLANPAVLMTQNWAKTYGIALSRTIEAIHPGWLKDFAGHIPKGGQRDVEAVRLALELGRDPAGVRLAQRAGVTAPAVFWPEQRTALPLAFLENKQPDHSRIAALMSLSEAENSYANGGPVSRLLESYAEDLLGLPDTHKSIACSNCTAGLFAIAGLEAWRRGKPLRWAGSAFTFFSSHIGPLSDVRLVDSDRRGGLHAEQLAALDEDLYDGVILTNVFAAHSDWSALAEFCRERGKALIVDNATGLLDRTVEAAPFPEVISCHHTKPWGFGEGGLIIVAREDEPVVRKLLNFGSGLPAWMAPYAANGKLSDLAAAAIYDRLERMPRWAHLYRSQVRRLMGIIERNRLPLTPVWSAPPRSPASSIPLVAEHPIAMEELRRQIFVARKYYNPPEIRWPARISPSGPVLAGDFPVARGLFERILNLPSHSGMAGLADEQILSGLEAILSPARRRERAFAS